MFHQGSMVALVTPMHADGSVDEAALATLVDFHIGAGTDAIVSVGTTGESSTLSVAEHAAVIGRTVELVHGRIPVIAGTGANATDEAIELSRLARAAGADAALSVTPYYNKPTQEGLFQHYSAIAAEGSLPLILYNVPGRTAVDMTAETTARLSRVANIVGIKESHGTVERFRELLGSCAEDFMIVSGDDKTAMEAMLAGGHGNISVTANVVPAEMAELCHKAIAGDRAGAEAIEAKIERLHTVLFCESSPIPTKWALEQMGLIGPGIRLPMTPLTSDYHQLVRDALISAGALKRKNAEAVVVD